METFLEREPKIMKSIDLKNGSSKFSILLEIEWEEETCDICGQYTYCKLDELAFICQSCNAKYNEESDDEDDSENDEETDEEKIPTRKAKITFEAWADCCGSAFFHKMSTIMGEPKSIYLNELNKAIANGQEVRFFRFSKPEYTTEYKHFEPHCTEKHTFFLYTNIGVVGIFMGGNHNGYYPPCFQYDFNFLKPSSNSS